MWSVRRCSVSSRRCSQSAAAVLSIYAGAILHWFRSAFSPHSVMGGVIQCSSGMVAGYMTGYVINAAIMITAGLLGLLLLWPNTERARLMAQAAQPKFA